MEKFKFSEEFHGCSSQWIVVQSNADLPRRWIQIFRVGGRGSFARTETDLPCCGFRLKMAETRRWTSCATMLKDRDRHRKDCSNYHCRSRTYLDIKYEQLNTERWKKQVRKSYSWLHITSAEFRTESTNCFTQNLLIVHAKIQGGYLRITRVVDCRKSWVFCVMYRTYIYTYDNVTRNLQNSTNSTEILCG